MKYVKGEQKDTIESGELGKMRLVVDGEDTENIWVRRLPNDKVSVLQNHALNLYPFSSWGTIIPSIGSQFDLKEMRDKFQLELHPEAYDGYLEQGAIDKDGNFIPPKQENEDTNNRTSSTSNKAENTL